MTTEYNFNAFKNYCYSENVNNNFVFNIIVIIIF